MRTSIQDLYGLDVDPTEWATMPYKDVLELKAKLAKERIVLLGNVNYRWRDVSGINECNRAISFNENLLKELIAKGSRHA